MFDGLTFFGLGTKAAWYERIMKIYLSILAVTLVGCVADTPGTGALEGLDCGGGCDSAEGIVIHVCNARDAALERPGCEIASGTDIGIDPVIAERAIPINVLIEGFADLEGVTVALTIYDGDQVVRSIAITDLSDGGHELFWDGHDESGLDVEAPFHIVRLEATDGETTLTSNEHVIATLVNLPDEGTGHNHPLGTDRANTDDWGRTHVVEALRNIAAEWSETSEIPIAFLDLSAQNGGRFEPHLTHRHGESVDVRYIRDDGEGRLDLRWHGGHYDQEATEHLIDLFFEHGAIEVFVDQRADLEGDDLVLVDGHANHFHATFGRTPDETGAARAINQGHVGGPCADVSDCVIRNALCLRPEGTPVGVYTRTCDGACGDYVGGIYTASECVETDEGYHCMPARDSELYPDTEGCRADLDPVELPSRDHNGASTEVCLLPPAS